MRRCEILRYRDTETVLAHVRDCYDAFNRVTQQSQGIFLLKDIPSRFAGHKGVGGFW